MPERITFAIAGDPHSEIIHDGAKRMEKFLRAAKEHNVDFIIHTGDLTYPNDCTRSDCPKDRMPENVIEAYNYSGKIDHEHSLRLFEGAGIPFYHVPGNHEFDFSSPEDLLKLYKMPGTYYAFHLCGWHFIVLDCNYFKRADGALEHYSLGQYFLTEDLPYVPMDQLAWLARELEENDEPVILFSHQPLFDKIGGIKNLADFEAVISEARARGKDIRMMINGHLHADEIEERDGIIYYGINSMSNMWVGENLAYSGRFPEEIEKLYSSLKYVIPYKEAVYSIVTLDDSGVRVEGVESKYVQPGPRKIGFKGTISAKARSWEKPFKRSEK